MIFSQFISNRCKYNLLISRIQFNYKIDITTYILEALFITVILLDYYLHRI